MPDLSISHLIYTRVEPAYSPESRNGFQVVHVSPEIRDDAVEIERMVECSSLSRWHYETGAPEYRYFWTQSGLAVVAQTVPMPPDRTVIDSMGREDSHFLVHALVLPPDQFARVRNDPFAVIEGATREGLLTDSIELLVHYIRDTPPRPIVSIPRRTELGDDIPDGWKQHLENLALVAQGADDLTSRKQSLLLLSDDSNHVYSLLSTLLYLMDVESRIHCTFSTYVDGCWPRAGTYWAVGARNRGSSSGFNTIEMSPAAIAVPNMTSSPKVSPYSTWWRKNLRNYVEFSVGMPEIYTAQIAAESLAARRALPTDDPLSERALVTFREVNLERYQSGLMKALTVTLGKRLTAQATNPLVTSLSIERVMNIGATESVTASDLSPNIYRWALVNAEIIKIWSDLLKFAQTAGFDPLIALASAKLPANLFNNLIRSNVLSACHQALDRLVQRGEFSAVLEDLRGIVELDRLVTAHTGAIIAEQTDLDALDDAAFVRLTTALLKTSPKSVDDRYPTRANHVKDKSKLKTIIQLAEKSDHLEAAFTESAQISE